MHEGVVSHFKFHLFLLGRFAQFTNKMVYLLDSVLNILGIITVKPNKNITQFKVAPTFHTNKLRRFEQV